MTEKIWRLEGEELADFMSAMRRRRLILSFSATITRDGELLLTIEWDDGTEALYFLRPVIPREVKK